MKRRRMLADYTKIGLMAGFGLTARRPRSVGKRNVLDAGLVAHGLRKQPHQLVELHGHLAADRQAQLLRFAETDRMVVRPHALAEAIGDGLGLLCRHAIPDQLEYL